MSSALTIFQYRTEFDSLLDDGYSEEEARAMLGPEPEPTRLAGPEPTGDVEIPPMPDGWQPDWSENGAHGGTHGPRRPTKTPGLNARIITQPLTARDSRPAPRLAKGKVVLSFGATVEKLAKMMAFQRGLKWYRLSPKKQDAFYALAAFALECLQEVERLADVNKSLPREIGDDMWANVPERRG